MIMTITTTAAIIIHGSITKPSSMITFVEEECVSPSIVADAVIVTSPVFKTLNVISSPDAEVKLSQATIDVSEIVQVIGDASIDVALKVNVLFLLISTLILDLGIETAEP